VIRKNIGLLATRPAAYHAAEECLESGGTALDAVLTGVLTTAGEDPETLFSPLVLAVAGLGVGCKFFDGRVHQPGLDVPRPVRYVRAEDSPLCARLSVPTAPFVIAVASALGGTRRLSSLVAHGLKLARKEGATARVRLLEGMRAEGGRVLLQSWFWQELQHQAPRIEGGLITETDIVSIRPQTYAPRIEATSSRLTIGRPPWTHNESSLLYNLSAGRELMLAADSQGIVAVAIWEHAREGIDLFGGELRLPAWADPVVKKIPRRSPGTPLPSPAPVGFLMEGTTDLVAALVATTQVQMTDEKWNIAKEATEQQPTWADSPTSQVDESLWLALRRRNVEGSWEGRVEKALLPVNVPTTV